MSQPSDPRSADVITELPDPELNPLLNPVFGRHLARWVHTYFTSLPAQRRDALVQLLAELKALEGSSMHAAEETGATAPVSEGHVYYSVLCNRCEASNPRQQKFCGMCGAHMPLVAAAAASPAGERNPQLPVGRTGSVLYEAETARAAEEDENIASSQNEQQYWRDYAGGPTSLLFQAAPTKNDTPGAIAAAEEQRETDSQYEPVDADWLRERKLLSYPAERSSTWLVALTVLILAAVCLGSWVYIRARSTRAANKAVPALSGSSESITPAPAEPAPGQSREGAPVTSVQPAPQAAGSAIANETNSNEREEAGAVSKAGRTRENGSSVPSSALEAGAPEPGAAEVNLARQQLTNHNPAGAARLLWTAFGKKNSEAAVLLAGLYERGEGVEKNCTQSRVLLQAAVRNKAPGAAEQLRQLGSCD